MELELVRLEPRFLFLYFNIGKYFEEKRFVFQFFKKFNDKLFGLTLEWSTEDRKPYFEIVLSGKKKILIVTRKWRYMFWL
jgi:hypothetical protein